MRQSKSIIIACGAALLLLLMKQWAFGGLLSGRQSDDASFRLEKIAEGFGVVWGMTFLSPSEILFTEREGRIKLINLETGKAKQIYGSPQVLASGQGGLLDVAIPKNYVDGDWIYFTYSKRNNGKGVTTLARARLKGNRLVGWKDILITKSATASTVHFGSRIAFDDEGHVFITVGDRGGTV